MSSLRSFFDHFRITNINFSLPFMNAELEFEEADKEAAWALYIELITRSAIQPLPEDCGSEAAVLESIYSIFPTTREILKKYGRKGKSFSKIAILALNQVLRPFTSKWHRSAQNGKLEDPETAMQFRRELSDLQYNLRVFVKILAKIAEFDDMPFYLLKGECGNDGRYS